MNTPIILSATNSGEANSVFKKWLNEPSNTVTLLLVLDDDAVAEKGREYVHSLLASAPEDYESVAFLFVPKPSFLLNQLRSLTVKTDEEDFDWKNIDKYAVVSISPDNNFISAFVTKEALDEEPAEIQIAILMAFSNAGLNNP